MTPPLPSPPTGARVLVDHLQHAKARLTAIALLTLLYQALIHQRREPFEYLEIQWVRALGRGADRLDRLQRRAPREHRQAAEERALGRGEQVLAPGDGRPHRLLPLLQVACPSRQQLEAVGEAGEQRLGRQQLDPRGRQLDRQRQAIQLGADLGDGRDVGGGDGEVHPRRLRPFDEERHRRIL